MAVNFKYLPLAPEPLSGPSFIEQTERGFNELGLEIDNNTNTVNEALDTANKALQTSEDALETAQNAVGTATVALNTANTALHNSNTALANSNAALTTANNAYDTADNAISIANAAKATSEAANVTANAANTTANTASNDASDAVSTARIAAEAAQNAIEIASSANDMYLVNDEILDIDEVFKNPQKSYLTNASVAGLPVAVPCFFNVMTTEDNSAAVQNCWNDETTLYRRFATIDNTDPDNLVATWSEWAAVGGGVRIATDAEATAGILETVAVNPKQLTPLQSQINTALSSINIVDDKLTDMQNHLIVRPLHVVVQDSGGALNWKTPIDLSAHLPEGAVLFGGYASMATTQNGHSALAVGTDLNDYTAVASTNNYFATAGHFVLTTNNQKMYVGNPATAGGVTNQTIVITWYAQLY